MPCERVEEWAERYCRDNVPILLLDLSDEQLKDIGYQIIDDSRQNVAFTALGNHRTGHTIVTACWQSGWQLKEDRMRIRDL